jgi:hypothetical protein
MYELRSEYQKPAIGNYLLIMLRKIVTIGVL